MLECHRNSDPTVILRLPACIYVWWYHTFVFTTTAIKIVVKKIITYWILGDVFSMRVFLSSVLTRPVPSQGRIISPLTPQKFTEPYKLGRSVSNRQG